MDDLTDEMLIRRSLTGDHAATGLLVRRHYRAAFAVALATSASYADAEDACQDALVRAVDRLEECRHRDRFPQWLFTIVRNTARNRLRAETLRSGEPLEPDAAPATDHPGHDAERSDLRTRLVRALDALSPVQREIVLLHDLDGQPHEDIARALSISVVNARQHLFQARRRLRQLLEGDIGKEYLNE